LKEGNQNAGFIVNDVILKLMFTAACVGTCVGIGFLIYGIVKNEFVGYLVGTIVLVVGITIFIFVMILICKHKHQVNKIVNQIRRPFFDKKETSFERNYFNNSIYADRSNS
jgi:hypothetical protein